MPLQRGQVSKLRLFKDAQQARYENSRDIRMFLEESELWTLSRISHHESETGLKQVYTVYLYNLELAVILNAQLSRS